MVLGFVLLLPSMTFAEETQPLIQLSGDDESISCQVIICENGEGVSLHPYIECQCFDGPIPRSILEGSGQSSGGGNEDSEALLPPPAFLDDDPRTPDLPWIIRRPTPVYGFPLERRQKSFTMDFGFPFADFHFDYGVTSVVNIGVGVRSFYGFSFGGYGTIKVRLHQNFWRTRSLSLVARIGYNSVGSAFSAAVTGADHVFGEILLASSIRRGRHAIVLSTGYRVGRYAGECMRHSMWDCSNDVARNDQGIIVTYLLDFGFSVRMTRTSSFYVASGVNFYVNTDWDHWFFLNPNTRMGFIFDF